MGAFLQELLQFSLQQMLFRKGILDSITIQLAIGN